MFWDKVAGVYDVFANVINRKVHKELKAVVADLISPSDKVLECACGTGMLSAVIAPRCKTLTAPAFERGGGFCKLDYLVSVSLSSSRFPPVSASVTPSSFAVCLTG